MFNIKNIKYILKRELKAYFVSPIAYIVISIFLILTGLLFFPPFFIQNEASLRGFFNMLPWIFAIFVPMLTMRLFSEEIHSGSFELLVTMPVSTLDIIMGKFLAAVAFIKILLLPTLAYAITLLFFSDWTVLGVLLGGYIGAILIGASYAAIGIFCSSLSRNQIISLIVAFIICIFLWGINKFAPLLPNFLVGFFRYFGTDYHFQNIAKGVIDSRDILYFLSIMFLGVYGTYLVILEKK